MSKSYWCDKTAVVCGASSGLGYALARALAESGVHHLALLARDEEKLKLSAAELHRQCPSVRILPVAVDLLDQLAVQKQAAQIASELGPVDVVVQAVGSSDRGTLMDLTHAKLEQLLDVNLFSSLHCLQAFRAHLRPECSHLLLIGSLASLLAPRFLGGYALAKHALAALAQQARLELSEQGVHVTLACPGPIARSDAGQRYAEMASEAIPQQALQPGGGAALKGLDPRRLADSILLAVSRRRPVVVRPRKVALLRVLCAISPRLGEWILRRATS